MHRPRIHLRNWKADVLSGVIVALGSIPSSMGYAQIAGLPPVYGLYGSVLPILVYGLLSTSPRFVVGVDAMPAFMVGKRPDRDAIRLETAERGQWACFGVPDEETPRHTGRPEDRKREKQGRESRKLILFWRKT